MRFHVRLILLAASLTSTTFAFPDIGASSTRRIMLLHGTGSTASSFMNSPTKRGAKDFLAGVPAEGIWSSNALWNKPGMKKARWNWQVSALDADGPDGNWYSSDGVFQGVEDSVARVEQAILDRHWPVGFDSSRVLSSHSRFSHFLGS